MVTVTGNPPLNVEVTFTGFGDEAVTFTSSATTITAGTTLTVTVTETFDSYVWYLDQAIQAETSDEYSWTVPSFPFIPSGPHNLTVIVKKGTSYYSKALTFTVEE
jgi:hypothetical protein